MLFYAMKMCLDFDILSFQPMHYWNINYPKSKNENSFWPFAFCKENVTWYLNLFISALSKQIYFVVSGEEFVDLVSASDALSLTQYKSFSMRIFRSRFATNNKNYTKFTTLDLKIEKKLEYLKCCFRANFKGKRALTREMANPLRVYRKAIPCPKVKY